MISLPGNNPKEFIRSEKDIYFNIIYNIEKSGKSKCISRRLR